MKSVKYTKQELIDMMANLVDGKNYDNNEFELAVRTSGGAKIQLRSEYAFSIRYINDDVYYSYSLTKSEFGELMNLHDKISDLRRSFFQNN